MVSDEARIGFCEDGRDKGVWEGDFEQQMGVRGEDYVEGCWTRFEGSENGGRQVKTRTHKALPKMNSLFPRSLS